ncbi:hypothetical protein Poli38472_005240 [Pythium oligandrum]|uniref:Uncharacterized protein n=1 Tax=Pythium oligandrum TaxID=41045 RepID=A0A8K1CI93_PYTOL|nr:hypothetical protein Poli38472_005240 [Pythium oligandrum]|eukprot:TMW62622.1 hypothetical protein Poli38472_005240 [Pythium oligandrum]
MESALTSKQAETAKCYRALTELHQYALTPPTKTMLQQIFSVLFRATYELSDQDRVSEIISEPMNNVEVDIDPAALDELAGYEYFSLYTHLQSALATVENKQYLLETQYAMECTLERNLVACVEQLDQDLAMIRTQHRESHDRVQQELLAVAQLDDEYAMLITHEEELRREVDGLTQQLNKQETLLENIHSKSTYLDFVSRAP